ncbi:uncharacterized protein LOC117227021 [Megalopta genalis]|uniref:uncharacterized protein LOC117227021 n=1 Tax=Megalopta genalis TaxID=115081 RepID=UPI003FD1FEFA
MTIGEALTQCTREETHTEDAGNAFEYTNTGRRGYDTIAMSKKEQPEVSRICSGENLQFTLLAVQVDAATHRARFLSDQSHRETRQHDRSRRELPAKLMRVGPPRKTLSPLSC